MLLFPPCINCRLASDWQCVLKVTLRLLYWNSLNFVLLELEFLQKRATLEDWERRKYGYIERFQEKANDLDHTPQHCSLLSYPMENSWPNHLEYLGNVFRVALLRDIAQLGCDIDSPTDVHVHLHGLFLNLCVQVCHGLQEGQQWLSSIIIQFRKEEIPHSISLTPGHTILKQYYIVFSGKGSTQTI